MKSMIMNNKNCRSPKIPGLFVGLCNLDIVYYSDSPMPEDNSKKKITDFAVAIGGPAANAAITYSLMGGEAYLLCAIGSSQMGTMIKSMLAEYQVNVIDIAEEESSSCNISCIHVNTANGDRTIISGQSGKGLNTDKLSLLPSLVEKCHFALYDGNLLGVENALVQQLTHFHKELVLDAGSFKDGFPTCFAMRPTVISSEGFVDKEQRDVFELSKIYGFAHSAQTRGANTIRYENTGQILEIPVRSATAVDTLGAGDIFHGAYCYFNYVQNLSFEGALSSASRFASYSVEKRGVVAGIEFERDMFVKERK